MKRALAAVAAITLLVVVTVIASRPAPVETETPDVEVGGPDGPIPLEVEIRRLADTGGRSPALLLAHGFGGSAAGLRSTAEAWARRGYVVLTWSARGFGRSGGAITLNDPDAEIADISVLVDLLAERDDVTLDAEGDPLVGIAGGSYGGGAALLAVAQDPRIDAAVAVAAWHDLPRSLAPNATGGVGVPKSQWLSVLFTAGGVAFGGGPAADGGGDGFPGDGRAGGGGFGDGSPAATPFGDGLAAAGAPTVLQAIPDQVLRCGRFAEALCRTYQESAAGDRLTPQGHRLLDRASLTDRLDEVDTPTLLVHGLDDTLFGLQESLDNAIALQAAGAPVALRWIDAAHTGLGSPGSAADREAQAWLARWLQDEDSLTDVVFSWHDRVSGEQQQDLRLPSGSDETLRLLATTDGTLSADADDAPPTVTLLHPAGGLPATFTGLPGFGDLAELVPSFEIPGQHVTFTTEALDEDVVVVGGPVLRLADPARTPTPSSEVTLAPVVFAKLYDVTPGGTSRLINATVFPLRLDGTTEIELGALAHRFVAGNRLRLTLATTDQGFDTGTDARTIEVPLGSGAGITLPVTVITTADPLPAAVRIAIPVGLVALLALAGFLLTRRWERTHPAATDDPDEPVVRIRGLVKRYADGKLAVDEVDVTVEQGQVVGLLGPNGAGKTSVMRMLLGLVAPTAGTIEVLGHSMRPGHPVLGRVGVLVEGPGFAPYLTGRQNLESYWLAGGRPLEEADLQRALDVADLGPAIDRPVRAYSHGMKQRLAIAQALLGEPDLLVLDEPTDGLDPEQIRAMRQLLARLGEQGLTILVSSHLLAEVEQMCTHAVVMQQGKVIAEGPVAELMGATRSVVVRVGDRERAREVLTSLLADGSLDVEGSGLVVELGSTPTAEVVAALVRAGVAVESVTPRGRLEDTFLALTGGQR